MSIQLNLPHYLGFNHFLIFPSRCVVSFFLLDCLILYSKVEPSISYIFKVFFEVIVFIQMLKRKISQEEMGYRSVATAKSYIFEVMFFKGQAVYHLVLTEMTLKTENLIQSGEVTLPLSKDSVYVAMQAKHPECSSV